MYELMNFYNFLKKTGKKHCRSILKKIIFDQTYTKFDGCHGNLKNDGHAIDNSKFPQRIKKTARDFQPP